MALCVARHGERADYAVSAGDNWQLSAYAAEHGGWDPPLTGNGVQQAAAMGVGLKERLEQLALPPVTRVFSSPLTRCLQTAAAAAASMGLSEIAVEHGLTEGMLEDWYRSWAIPGANSAWGGPPGARSGTPLPSDATLHPKAHVPASEVLMAPMAAQAALERLDTTGITVNPSHQPIAPPPSYQWGQFESEELLADRIEATLTALKARFPHETILCVSHGGPCEHAYRRLLKTESGAKVAGYTAVYIYKAKGEGTGWEAAVAGDTTHLARLQRHDSLSM